MLLHPTTACLRIVQAAGIVNRLALKLADQTAATTGHRRSASSGPVSFSLRLTEVLAIQRQPIVLRVSRRIARLRCMSQPISADLVGLELPPVQTSWNEKDVMLYALGVGARPPGDLDFVYEGCGPVALPTYGVIPGLMAAMGGVFGEVEVNPTMILHGEQSITCHRTLPPRAAVEIYGQITEVWDKGEAAVLGFEGTASDGDDDLFTTRATLLVRGAGGFGGERGPSTTGKNEPPDRDPDVVIQYETRAEQAAIYRLSGDRSPLHIDPEFAMMGGFDAPFNHGLCTFGFVGRAVLAGVFGGDVDAFGALEGRFADQVWPEDTIISRIWSDDDGAIIEACTQKGNVVLSQARATAR